MQRHIIIASHERLALGFKQTLEFISGKQPHLHVLTAYMDNKPIESAVSDIMNDISSDDEAIVLTDMLAGSVNQKFFPYKNRPHTHIITGINLPLVLAFVMENNDNYISVDRVREIVEQAKQQLIYVNDIDTSADSDDE
ncbi:PTS N-acetylglucosamine transporter subunit IIBC [Pediococcus ethanolidurans]|uniref:PTS sugar transporter subunit IIA n=1 Tax=Pediococcus ethanolidurans TaxID=319653 RepID=UPI002954C6A1|nr:PTS N-acetylglucosamine transporter subunit IIBC [Pediococcus ethanolidurans]MDV7718290.1 PTS N-acetylglucosamine transporter subunit IIBC [Pediococcus ethanolidurans]